MAPRQHRRDRGPGRGGGDRRHLSPVARPRRHRAHPPGHAQAGPVSHLHPLAFRSQQRRDRVSGGLSRRRHREPAGQCPLHRAERDLVVEDVNPAQLDQARGTGADGRGRGPRRGQQRTCLDSPTSARCTRGTFGSAARSSRSSRRSRWSPRISSSTAVLTLPLGRRVLELRDRGKANSPHDVTIWLPQDRVLFSGDILVEDPYPYTGASWPVPWAGVLRDLEAIPVAVLVPGHGPVMRDHSYTRLVREMMEAVTARVDLPPPRIHAGAGPGLGDAGGSPDPLSGGGCRSAPGRVADHRAGAGRARVAGGPRAGIAQRDPGHPATGGSA